MCLVAANDGTHWMPLAEPLGSAEPRLRNTGLGHRACNQHIASLTAGRALSG